MAAIYSVGLGDMGQYVERFQADNRNAKVQIEYLHPDQVYQRVRDEQADFGLVSFPSRSRDLTVLPWREEEMVVACPRGHPLARFKRINPARLDGEKFVAFDKGLVIRREVDRFLRDHGVETEVVLEFDNIENIKKAVEVGTGVALLPEPTLRQEVQRGLAPGPAAGRSQVRAAARHHPSPAAASSAAPPAPSSICCGTTERSPRTQRTPTLLDATPWPRSNEVR